MTQAGQDRQGPGRAPASHDVRARPSQPGREAAPAGNASRSTVGGRDAPAAAGRDTSPRAGPDAAGGSGATRRVCAWCGGPFPARARRDAIGCGAVPAVRPGTGSCARPGRPDPSRVAARYALASTADPAYPGNAWRYRSHPDYAGEVDHTALISRLPGYGRGSRCPPPPKRCPRCWPCARPGCGWRPGTAANAPPPAGHLCAPGNPSSTAGGRQVIRDRLQATTHRFDRLRRRPGHHPARPGDRRQTRRSVPVDLRSARRRARRHPR